MYGRKLTIALADPVGILVDDRFAILENLAKDLVILAQEGCSVTISDSISATIFPAPSR